MKSHLWLLAKLEGAVLGNLLSTGDKRDYSIIVEHGAHSEELKLFMGIVRMQKADKENR